MCARSWFRQVGMGVLAVCVGAVGAAGEPNPDREPPTEPGIHHLSFTWQPPEERGGESDGEAEASVDGERMTYGLFIPERFEQAKQRGEKLPLVVYLCGAGMRGHAEDELNNNGPIAEMRRNEHLGPKLKCMIVQPQLHREARWENPRMGGYVADVARRVMARYPIDADRVYLAGMSMGGEGVWHAALAAPDLYALVLSMGGRQHPEPAEVARAMDGASAWIVVGENDGAFTGGSRVMRRALSAAGVDLVYKEVEGFGHNIWRMFWNKHELYALMGRYRRGSPPEEPPTARTLEQIAKRPPPDPQYARFARTLQERFERFRPWWQIENCRRHRSTGMLERWGGREPVLATLPLNRHMPCRLMTTAEPPAGKRTKLVLEVAAERPWVLEVEGNGRRLLRTRVRPTDAEQSPWRKVEVDLTGFAGGEVFLEVLHRGRGGVGYWSGIEMIHE